MKRRKASKKPVRKAARKPGRILRPAKRKKTSKPKRIPWAARRRKFSRLTVIGPTTAGYSLVPSLKLPVGEFDPSSAVRALLGPAPETVRPPGSLSVQSSPLSSPSPHVLRLTPQAPVYDLRAARSASAALPRIGESWKLNPGSQPNFVVRVRAPVASTFEFLIRLPAVTLEAYLDAVEGAAGLTGRLASLPIDALRRLTPWRDENEDMEVGPRIVSSGVLAVPGPGERRSSRDLRRFLSLPSGWPRAVAPFVLLAILFSVPLHAFSAASAIRASKASIVNSGRRATRHLGQAAVLAASADLGKAEREFGQGRAALLEAEAELRRLPAAARELARLVPGGRKSLQASETLLASGAVLSEAAASLSSEIRRMGDETNVIYKITVVRNAVDAALPAVTAAAAALSALPAHSLPGAQAETLAALRSGVDSVEAAFGDLVPLSEAVMNLLGRDGQRRYLIVFQNSSELRPTGGFMGSFAELSVRRGAVERLVTPPGGTYDLQGQLKALVLPPEPLRLLTGRWFFHDANWFPDYPTTARKLQWFYEKSGGPSTDGVIAVNSALLPELLRVVGPVTVADGRIFTAENALSAIEDEVESPEARAGGRPKSIISELAAAVIERLSVLPADRFLQAAGVLGDALRSKRLLIYSNDPLVQKVIRDRRWDGSIPQSDGDFLGLVTANIGGEKTDQVIDEAVEHESAVAADGSVIDTVVIRRTHSGVAGKPMTGVRNFSYLRLYVPKGSELLSVTGDFGGPPAGEFEGDDPVYEQDRTLSEIEHEVGIDPASGTRVTEEFGKSVFGNWMILDPGETKVIRFIYRLPLRLALPEPPRGAVEKAKRLVRGQSVAGWRLTVWHQPGAERRRVSTVLRLPSGLRLAWQTPRERNLEQSVLLPETGDVFIGAIITAR